MGGGEASDDEGDAPELIPELVDGQLMGQVRTRERGLNIAAHCSPSFAQLWCRARSMVQGVFRLPQPHARQPRNDSWNAA